MMVPDCNESVMMVPDCNESVMMVPSFDLRCLLRFS